MGGLRLVSVLDRSFPTGVSVALSGVAAGFALGVPAGTLTASSSGDVVKPTADNTGPRISLTSYSGDWRVSTQGDPSGRDISGAVYLDADDIDIADFKCDVLAINRAPGGNYFLPVKKNQKISYAAWGSTSSQGADTVTWDYCHIGGMAATFAQIAANNDGSRTFPCQNITITNCLFDNLQSWDGTGNPPHWEALHLMGCVGATITNNVFDFRAPDATTKARITASVSFDSALNGGGGDTCADVVFTGNYLYGGGRYQILTNLSGASVVSNNVFHRETSPLPSTGVQSTPIAGRASFTHSGNTLATGTPDSADTDIVAVTLGTA